MNYVFGGQFSIGRTYNLFGPFSGGKTSLCNYLAGELQTKVPTLLNKPDKNVVIFADFERSFEIDFATQNGLKVDEDHLIFMKPDSIEEFVDAACDFIQTGCIAGIIWDSEAASITRTQMASEAGKACISPNSLVEFYLD
jgi:RecA/RadA recombinase